MSLSHAKNCEILHQKMLRLTKQHRLTEAELLDHLQEADRLKLFLVRGHSSLFKYVSDELGFSDSVTSNMIAVARKAMEIPKMKEEIRNGNLGIAKLRKVCPVIDQENQKEWIDIANTSSSRDLEMQVASRKENHIPKASVRAVAKDTLRLSLDISTEARQKLDQLKDILVTKRGRVATKRGRDCSLQEVLDFALETTLEKHDPMRKAERSEKRKVAKSGPQKEQSQGQGDVQSKPTCPRTGKSKRKSIPQKLVDLINRRDKRRCTYVGALGQRCTQTRWLHYHHHIPVAQGGSNHEDNLKTLCDGHHRLVHLEMSHQERGR